MTNYDVMKLALEKIATVNAMDYEYQAWAREALTKQPAPPPECQTDAEKTAFAFGWWKALEHIRMKKTSQYSDIISTGGMDPRK